MLSLLNKNNSIQFGIDATFKIIPKCFKKYKLITIYGIDKNDNIPKLACLICIQYMDSKSLIKLLSQLYISYNFSPYSITTDFAQAQIKALMKCEVFNRRPYIICCLFHFSQAIIKNMNKNNLINKKLNKRGVEILRNLEMLCFVDINKINAYFDNLKNIINLNDNEKNFMNYFEKTWLKKYKKLFNYSRLLQDTIKCKNLYINKKGKNNSYFPIKDKLKSLNKLYLTNNICENIHSCISKHLPNTRITKNNFRDTLNFIIKDNEFKNIAPIRRDYISRTLIIIYLKYDLDNKFKFITYDIFKKELENTIAVMTGKLSLNAVDEIANILNEFEDNEELLDNNSEKELDNEDSIDSICEDSVEILEKDEIDIIIDNEIKEFNDNINLLEQVNEHYIDNSDKSISNHSSNDSNLDIELIKNSRSYLNLFTLDNNFNNDTIHEILLGEENDIVDLENQMEDVEIKSFDEKKSKKNTKIKYPKKY